MKKVCSINACWIFALMLILPGSVLHAEDPPAIQVQPASTEPVPPALRQALASSLGEAVSMDAKAIPAPPTGGWGIVSEGDGGGGIFRDSDSEAEAWLGSNGFGISGYGSTAGGYFEDSDNTSHAYLGYGNYGIQGHGTYSGGYFVDSDNSGYANVGIGNYGIQAFGNAAGGYFKDSDGTGYSYVGFANRGIEAYGTEMGGYFKDSNATGYAYVGNGDYGIRGYGTVMGGFFKDIDSSGYASAGYGDRGIDAGGTEMGGHFEDSNDSGYAYVGYGDSGIRAFGNSYGAFFKNADGTSFAAAGYGRLSGGFDNGGYANDGEYGVYADGPKAGGYFEDSAGSAYAYVGYGNFGIVGSGNFTGGYFEDSNSAGHAYVGHSTYKIFGSGTVSFVQNHPLDRESVIVYAAPEGDEVATYTRGTARLVDGEATVQLGETFKWVTNPDIGLTAHLTPREDCNGVYVADLSTEEIVVRELQNGTSDCAFDYIVYGLRIGFEESSIVQEKEMESYIPAMTDHRKLYERRPDLRRYNSLERFKGMHHATSPKTRLDLSRAQTLRDAIIEFDPAVHELPKAPGHEERPVDDLALEEARRESVQAHERVRAARGDHDRQPATDQSDLSAAIPVDDDPNVYATSFRPPSREVVTLVDLSESVKPGDVLVIDRDTAGLMRRGFEGHDSGVVGVVLDSQPPALSGEEVEAETALHAEVAMAGVVRCKVDATYGAIWPGNLLVTSPTSGHAMRTDSPLPGTIVGKALEPLEEGTGTIRVLVMLR